LGAEDAEHVQTLRCPRPGLGPEQHQALTGRRAEDGVTLQDQTAHALEVDSGRHRWLRHYDGTFTRLLAFGGSTVLAAKSGSILIDHQGVVTADLAGYLELTAAADTVLGWGPDRAEVFDSAGRLITGFDIAAVNVVSSARPGLAIPEGVLLFDLDWTFGAWTDA